MAGASAVWAQDAPPPDDPWLQATLYRDEWGVPHVYAQTPRALGFAFGYAQAEDHLDAMLMAYRMANGRASEVLGESSADADAFALRLGHARLARAAFETIDPVTSDLCFGFAQGVNTWLAEHPGDAPAWAENVQPADILALWHALIMSMAPLDLPDGYHPPRAFDTSNAWALAPSRTENKQTILVINPHQHFDGAFQWYEAHLVMGDLNIAGAALYGLPVILQGHNGTLGWALTPNAPDFADVFEERFTPSKDGSKKSPIPGLEALSQEQVFLLKYMAESQPYRVRTASGMEERYVPTAIGPRGPLLERGGSQLFSWRIGGFFDFGGLRQLFDMGRAQTLDDFQAALAMQQIPCFHVLYADRAGNLFYLYNAKTGDRAMPEAAFAEKIKQGADYLDWKRPAPASVDAMTWAHLVEPDALPRILNPESGYLQACGNPPWTTTDKPPFTNQDLPLWFAADPDSPRAQRVRLLLHEGTRSFRDIHAMLYDVVAPAAVEMTPILLDMAKQRPELVSSAHPDLVTGLDLLRDWNYVAETASPGMTFYHLWWAALRAGGRFPTDTDEPLYAMMRANTPQAQELALNAAAEAARMMRNDFQNVSVPWGDVHRLQRGKHDDPAAGALTGEPIFTMDASVYANGRWRCNYGYGFAMAVQFGESTEAVSIVPFGASDRIASPHYADQSELLLQKRLKRMRFTQDAVWRHAEAARGRRVILYPLGVEGAFTVSAPVPIEARLSTSAGIPGPVPEGMVPFTLSVQPVHAPKAVPVEITVEMRVPPALCLPENLDALALFAFEKDLGWYLLPVQHFDKEQALLSGVHAGAEAYAVLGPKEFLIKTEETEPSPPPGNTVPKPDAKRR